MTVNVISLDKLPRLVSWANFFEKKFPLIQVKLLPNKEYIELMEKLGQKLDKTWARMIRQSDGLYRPDQRQILVRLNLWNTEMRHVEVLYHEVGHYLYREYGEAYFPKEVEKYVLEVDPDWLETYPLSCQREECLVQAFAQWGTDLLPSGEVNPGFKKFLKSL